MRKKQNIEMTVGRITDFLKKHGIYFVN